MRKNEKKPVGNAILRLVLVGIAFLFQVGWLLLLILELNEHSAWISLLSSTLALVAVLRLYSKHTNAAMKMPWILLIATFPVMGLSLYLMFVLLGDPGVGKRLRAVHKKVEEALHGDSRQVLGNLDREDRSKANQFRYVASQSGWPVYQGTRVTYYPEAVQALEAMKEALEQAERFIFMEYFIVADESSFRELREILVRKAKAGVEVRLMYDDIGSVGYVNMRFAQGLNAEGIHCQVFNPALPVLNLFLNHRDHRKITVIDGKVGFTGGYNLADEYFDREKPYGKWKDTGLKLEGEAVQSLTAQFLELWNLQTRADQQDAAYLAIREPVPAEGFVQPFTDNPLDSERLAENVYINLASRAQKKLWFITPYLIISDEMSLALTLAAKRGVDVRIITPGVPDKKTVYAVTRSYYAGLATQGVRIFEYSPGFCHAKMCLCDGEMATVGTSNLDYRSLYHHFENNVLFSDCPAVRDVAADFESLFPQCQEVTQKYRSGRNRMLRIWQCILRLFAPLM